MKLKKVYIVFGKLRSKFWLGVKSESALLNQKHGSFNYLEYSKRTWQHFCKRHGYIFIEYNKTLNIIKNL